MIIIERFDCVFELTLQTTMSGLLVIHIGRLETYLINVIYWAQLNLRISVFAISTVYYANFSCYLPPFESL